MLSCLFRRGLVGRFGHPQRGCFIIDVSKKFMQTSSPNIPFWLPPDLEEAFVTYKQKLRTEYDHLTNILSDTGKTDTLRGTALRWEEISPIISLFEELDVLLAHDAEIECLVSDVLNAGNERDDDDLLELAHLEKEQRSNYRNSLEEKLFNLIVPSDPSWQFSGASLELVAAAGGREAGLFARELLEMYQMFAMQRGWHFTLVHESLFPPEGGVINASRPLSYARASIVGDPDEAASTRSCMSLGAYGQLYWESGVHRVQRIPITSSQHKIHTSTVAISVLPLSDEVTVDVAPKDLKWEFYRSSGAGGQHVNTTDSAVRLTHLPSGVVVTCQQDRSQLQNKDTALRILRERLLQMQQKSQTDSEDAQRQSHFGHMDRSDKIRTYNFPQDRITDHRLSRSWIGIHRFMSQTVGLGEFVQAMFERNQMNRLRETLINKSVAADLC